MNYRKSFFRHKQQGFALLGASLLIVVAALTILGTLNQNNLTYNDAKRSMAQQRLAQVNTALFSYAMANGFWPCPASLRDASTVSSFGAEQRTNSTTCATGAGVNDLFGTVYHGMAPVQTLGLDKDFAADTWGNKIEYYISQVVVGDINQPGVINITGPMGASISTPYTIISRGTNGYGGYPINSGTQNALPPSINANEAQNLLGNNFIIDQQSNFDDLIIYLANSSVANQYTNVYAN